MGGSAWIKAGSSPGTSGAMCWNLFPGPEWPFGGAIGPHIPYLWHFGALRGPLEPKKVENLGTLSGTHYISPHTVLRTCAVCIAHWAIGVQKEGKLRGRESGGHCDLVGELNLF